MGTRQRIGAGLALAGLAQALVFAALAPGLTPLARAARIAIDLVLAAGFVAFLRGDRAPAPPRSPVSRALAVTLVAAGGIFAIVARTADPWRRGFRAALSFALALGIALGIDRSVPRPRARGARALIVVLLVLEFAAGLAATIEIDVPLALAALAPPAKALALRLEDGGYALAPPLAGTIVRALPQAFALRRGRLIATTRLADTLHLLGDDPVPALARALADPRARAQWRSGRIDACVLARVIRPPLRGYRDRRYGEAVAATVRRCRELGRDREGGVDASPYAHR